MWALLAIAAAEGLYGRLFSASAPAAQFLPAAPSPRPSAHRAWKPPGLPCRRLPCRAFRPRAGEAAGAEDGADRYFAARQPGKQAEAEAVQRERERFRRLASAAAILYTIYTVVSVFAEIRAIPGKPKGALIGPVALGVLRRRRLAAVLRLVWNLRVNYFGLAVLPVAVKTYLCRYFPVNYG